MIPKAPEPRPPMNEAPHGLWSDDELDAEDLINAHNAAGKSWKMAHNHFSHLTREEFREAAGLGRCTECLRVVRAHAPVACRFGRDRRDTTFPNHLAAPPQALAFRLQRQHRGFPSVSS